MLAGSDHGPTMKPEVACVFVISHELACCLESVFPRRVPKPGSHRRQGDITLLGGAAATWPVAAQPALPLIGYLNGASMIMDSQSGKAGSTNCIIPRMGHTPQSGFALAKTA
jgi:hypothetical protein